MVTGVWVGNEDRSALSKYKLCDLLTFMPCYAENSKRDKDRLSNTLAKHGIYWPTMAIPYVK
jgi:hypothetical protein